MAPARRLLAVILLVASLGCLGGCAATAQPSGAGRLSVVAAENFWGSIAAQIAGSDASVVSIVRNPAVDPHSYEPTAADARTLATANLVIVNGLAYDPWAPHVLAAGGGQPAVLTVGNLLSLHDGDNPHRWYAPANVDAVAVAIASDLERLDAKHADAFRARLADFRTRGLARYHALIAAIRSRYAGVPVGASESIFALLSPALGLRLVTPPSFMRAISEGTEVSASDTLTTQRQLADHEVKVWIDNSQNATPQIQRLNALARAQRIPVATVTETLAPASARFQDWQVAQLEALERALRQATGR